jgi:3-deoxy-D-manno-octulosonic-acid transferase
MRLLYTFGIVVYSLIIRLASLFNPKAKKWIKGRENWENNLPKTQKRIIWFHCASLGEFDQGLPLMNMLRQQYPDFFILVTFFSPSGMDHYHKRIHPADHVMYLPSDTIGNAKRFISKLNPTALFLIKYEFWSNYIIEASEAKVKIYSISTLLREDHRYFKWYGGFFRDTLKLIDHFFVQNEESARLLEKLGIKQYSVTGDTRFDRVIENSLQVKGNPQLEAFLNGQKAIIVGSSWPQDENILYPFLTGHPEEKFIIAPHDIREKHVSQIMENLGKSACRYTEWSEQFTGNIIVLNTIGQLANAYSYGKIAYVGGGFSGKLHNILEPAVFGLPVLFGPHFSRFPEAKLFIEEGIGFSVSTPEELENMIHSIDHSIVEISAKTAKVVNDNKGAAERVMGRLEFRI